MRMPSNNTATLAILAKLVFNNLMNDSRESNSQNLDCESSPKVMTNAKKEIGIHAVDAANRVYQSIIDAKAEAEKALENSFVDSLTNCFNRNYYNKFAKENFNPERDHNKIGIAYFDINNMKTTNDAPGGHKAGDKLLKDTADFLKSIFRKGDIVVRLGGDEFGVICHNNEDDDSFEDNLILRVEEKVLNSSHDLAFGIAIFDRDLDRNRKGDCDLDVTLSRADKDDV